MKIKDAARLGMLIETEGNIQVYRPFKKKGEDKLSSPHIILNIANTDMALINWAKSVMEEELGHYINVYAVSNRDKIRTKQCFRLTLGKLEDIYRLLNISRRFMVGIKKQIADRICSFYNYKNTIDIRSKEYSRAFDNLIDTINKVRQTYDQIIPVTTIRSPDPMDQKI